MGNSPAVLQQLIDGSHEFSKKLSAAKRPMIVLGSEAVGRSDGSAIQRLALDLSVKLSKTCEDKTWNVYNVLHKVIHISILYLCTCCLYV